jgi:hypothetical protein
MKTKNLLKMFMTEGLVGGDGVPQELPKLNPDMAQNKSPGGSNKIEVPQNKDGDNEPGTNKPDLSKDLKNDGDKEDSETKTELEATDRALAIAEYHLKKMNSMKDLKEVEDIDLDKMGAAHKIITDTRAALQEMIGKCGKKKVEKPIKESSENPEFAEFKILTTLPVRNYGDTEAAFEVAKKQRDDAIAAVKKEIKRFVPKYPSGVTFWAEFKKFDSKNLKYASAYYDVIIEGTKVFIDDLKKKYLEADDLPWYESIKEESEEDLQWEILDLIGDIDNFFVSYTDRRPEADEYDRLEKKYEAAKKQKDFDLKYWHKQFKDFAKKLGLQEKDSIEEDSNKELPDLETILKSPSQHITKSLDKNDFVQAGEKRISLVNEKYLPFSANKILLLPRETLLATIRSEAKGMRLIFSIGTKYYYTESMKAPMSLVPFKNQSTAGSVAGYLINPSKVEDGKKRLLNLE